jgi:hypothetical protein
VDLNPETANPDRYRVLLYQYEKEIIYKNLLFNNGYFSNEGGDEYIYTLNF